jgi:hypothetical protein
LAAAPFGLAADLFAEPPPRSRVSKDSLAEA